MRFIVTTREVWTQGISVEANTAAEAIDIVRDGGGELVDDLFEYSNTSDPETWTVENG
jgi:hypothetical protein